MNVTSASAVADPVSCQAQSATAKGGIAVPVSDTSCPTQTSLKAAIPTSFFISS